MKRSVILTDRLRPDILSAFWTKGQVLYRERAHLKVPGFSIVLNVLLTRKLPTKGTNAVEELKKGLPGKSTAVVGQIGTLSIARYLARRLNHPATFHPFPQLCGTRNAKTY